MNFSLRKQWILRHADQVADQREDWIDRNRYYYRDDHAYMQFLIQPGQRVLELGCGIGDLLSALNPTYGVGVDLSQRMVEQARSHYPDLHFVQGDIEYPDFLATIEETFDVIVLSDTVGYLDDCAQTLKYLHRFCNRDTRLVIVYYAWFWEPILKFGAKFGLKMPTVEMNWISTEDVMGFLHLADFEPVKREWRQIFPKSLFGIGNLLNRFVGTLPLVRRLCLRNYSRAPLAKRELGEPLHDGPHSLP